MSDITVADRHLKSYVLRMGRFTDSQKRSYNLLSGKFLVPFRECRCDPADFFPVKQPVTMEIGFGMGQATAQLAAENRDKNYIGIEVYKPGIGKLLGEIEKLSLTNIRIIEYDAAGVVDKMFAPSSLDAVHVFFPDPWPKKRHHKRRLIQRPFTDQLCGILKPCGYFYMVTDWEDYADWALKELTQTPGLSNAYADFAAAQEWRPRTAFESKGIKSNHEIRELLFIRKNESV
ncbi:MAG: tRNA (guanosine(46)-N7)-methyltransferase TrmB [Treponema sp.]|nr:tRNA (guanosine(46)-N7)-methyltransferase TrmB [Treponema sp.]